MFIVSMISKLSFEISGFHNIIHCKNYPLVKCLWVIFGHYTQQYSQLPSNNSHGFKEKAKFSGSELIILWSIYE